MHTYEPVTLAPTLEKETRETHGSFIGALMIDLELACHIKSVVEHIGTKVALSGDILSLVNARVDEILSLSRGGERLTAVALAGDITTILMGAYNEARSKMSSYEGRVIGGVIIELRWMTHALARGASYRQTQ